MADDLLRLKARDDERRHFFCRDDRTAFYRNRIRCDFVEFRSQAGRAVLNINFFPY